MSPIKNMGSALLGLQRALGLGSYCTAWAWLHKLRCAMVRPDHDRLCGIVEIDETYTGGPRSGKRGRGAEGKVLVVVAAEKNGKQIGRIRLKRVSDASADSLNRAVKEGVEPKTTVCTDGWRGYNLLGQLGYTRRIIRQESDVG